MPPAHPGYRQPPQQPQHGGAAGGFSGYPPQGQQYQHPPPQPVQPQHHQPPPQQHQPHQPPQHGFHQPPPAGSYPSHNAVASSAHSSGGSAPSSNGAAQYHSSAPPADAQAYPTYGQSTPYPPAAPKGFAAAPPQPAAHGAAAPPPHQQAWQPQTQASYPPQASSAPPNAGWNHAQPPAHHQQQANPASAIAHVQPWPEWVVPIQDAHMSSTMFAFPASQKLANDCNIPLAIMCQPLADTGEELPTVNFGPSGVVRCRSCRAYINPFVQFIENGARWRCNLCACFNDVLTGYYAAVDGEGQRVDRDERPELYSASYDIVAPAEYCVRPPQPPVFLFVIDVSERSIQSGMLEVVTELVLDELDSLPGGDRTMVGVITFDSQVHFYSLAPRLATPKMLVCADLDDMFLPQPNDLLAPVAEARPALEALLRGLPRMHRGKRDVESCVFSAIEAATSVIEPVGGEVLLFAAGLPSIGKHALKNRTADKKVTEDKLLGLASEKYKETGVEGTMNQITYNVFQFSNFATAYVDVATLSSMSQFSGGQSYFYPLFSAAEHTDKLRADLYRVLTRMTGWEAVVRIRPPRGVVLKAFHGNFYLRSKDLMSVPVVHPDQAFCLELELEDPELSAATYAANNCVYFQSAVLYTSSDGTRRIRIHTLPVPVSYLYADLIAYANAPAIAACIAKRAVQQARSAGMNDARALIQANIVDLFASYRHQTKGGRLSLATLESFPPSVQLLPSYCLGLLKHDAFRPDDGINADVRCAAQADLYALGTTEIETQLRPKMFSLDELLGDPALGTMDASGYVCQLPQEYPPTADGVEEHHAVLVDCGKSMVVRLGKSVDPQLVEALIGTRSVRGLSPAQMRFYPANPSAPPTDLRARVHCVVEYLRARTPALWQEVTVVLSGDASEKAWRNLLVDDQFDDKIMNLQEFVAYIDEETQTSKLRA